MNWLEEVLDATAELESSPKYFLWSGLAAISAILKNNVWVERYGGSDILTVFPNVYVLLVGPSGFRKGPPVALAKLLVDEVGGVRSIVGRSSIEGIIQDLAGARTVPGKKGPTVDSTAFIVSGEFSTALVRNPDALTILTDLHDGQYNKEWKNTLKHSGVERLERINITMLGGLNETHFNDMISEKEITGGFMARCQLVFAQERGKKNALLRPPNKTFTIQGLAQPLKRLKEMAGKFCLSEGAIEIYEKWYTEWEPEKSHDKTGSAMRVHDHILKVCQLVAAARIATSEGPITQIVEPDDMEAAKRLCLETTSRVGVITRGAGRSEMAVKQKAFVQALLQAPGYKLSRERLLQRCHGDFDVHDLNRMEETFVAAFIIKEVVVGKIDGKKDAIYELTQKTIDDYVK